MARILIIEDDDALRPLLSLVLQRDGHDVAEAREGGQGLRLAAAEEFDLVLCDVIMPVRDGLETIRELRKTQPHLPVIAMSGGMGLPCMDPLRIASLMGARRTIAKPFRVEQLLQVVTAALNDPCATGGSAPGTQVRPLTAFPTGGGHGCGTT
jgi:CheY-like chemotaxis protein